MDKGPSSHLLGLDTDQNGRRGIIVGKVGPKPPEPEAVLLKEVMEIRQYIAYIAAAIVNNEQSPTIEQEQLDCDLQKPSREESDRLLSLVKEQLDLYLKTPSRDLFPELLSLLATFFSKQKNQVDNALLQHVSEQLEAWPPEYRHLPLGLKLKNPHFPNDVVRLTHTPFNHLLGLSRSITFNNSAPKSRLHDLEYFLASPHAHAYVAIEISNAKTKKSPVEMLQGANLRGMTDLRLKGPFMSNQLTDGEADGLNGLTALTVGDNTMDPQFLPKLAADDKRPRELRKLNIATNSELSATGVSSLLEQLEEFELAQTHCFGPITEEFKLGDKLSKLSLQNMGIRTADLLTLLKRVTDIKTLKSLRLTCSIPPQQQPYWANFARTKENLETKMDLAIQTDIFNHIKAAITAQNGALKCLELGGLIAPIVTIKLLESGCLNNLTDLTIDPDWNAADIKSLIDLANQDTLAGLTQLTIKTSKITKEQIIDLADKIPSLQQITWNRDVAPADLFINDGNKIRSETVKSVYSKDSKTWRHWVYWHNTTYVWVDDNGAVIPLSKI